MLNFIVGLVIGMGLMWAVMKRKGKNTLDNPNAEGMQEKRENLEKVLAMAREKSEIRNDDVEDGLGVSNATAERYLQELESQGKLQQIGPTGQAVRYKLK